MGELKKNFGPIKENIEKRFTVDYELVCSAEPGKPFSTYDRFFISKKIGQSTVLAFISAMHIPIFHKTVDGKHYNLCPHDHKERHEIRARIISLGTESIPEDLPKEFIVRRGGVFPVTDK